MGIAAICFFLAGYYNLKAHKTYKNLPFLMTNPDHLRMIWGLAKIPWADIRKVVLIKGKKLEIYRTGLEKPHVIRVSSLSDDDKAEFLENFERFGLFKNEGKTPPVPAA